MNKAFLIGINTLNLRYAAQDVDLMSRVLRQHGYDITIAQHEKSQILAQLDNFIDAAKSTDTLIIYFSGHGHLVKGQLHLVLDDDLKNRAHALLNITTITNNLSNHCKAKNKLIILDCCHAEPTAEQWSFDISDSYRILTASERLEKAKEIDDLQASFLTYHIHDALSHHITEITNTKHLGISDLYRWLQKQTYQYNAQHQEAVPIPNLLGNEKNNFPLLTLDITSQQNDERIKEIRQGLARNINQFDTGIFREFLQYLRDLQDKQDLSIEDDTFLILLESFIKNELTADIITESWIKDIKSKKAKIDVQLNYDSLGEQLNNGYAVVFIASDIQENLIQKLVDENTCEEFQGDYPKACQFVEYRDCRVSLESKIKQELTKSNQNISYYQKLCHLLSSTQKNIVVLTACQDAQLEQTFRQQAKPYIVITPNINQKGIFSVITSDTSKMQPLVSDKIDCKDLLEKYSIIYKIKGCTHLQSTDGMSTLCLSETDYFQYANDIKKSIPESLIRQLQGKSLWFLGYYPKTWENRLLIQSLLNESNKHTSYTINAIAIDNKTTDFTELYWRKNSVQNHKVGLDEFIQKLQRVI